MALVDWDHDGDLDIWLTNRTAPRVRFLRNDTPGTGHFLALKLVGSRSNRDAIGARVEVVLGGQRSEVTDRKSEVRSRTSEGATGSAPLATRQLPLIKTLRAGEGFLGQSSKWLHFGLGAATDIERVVVRWPRGHTETFQDLAADHRYQIVEGTGQASSWARPGGSVDIQPSKLHVPKPSGHAATLLHERLPLPPLSFESFDGRNGSISQFTGQPLLVNLWATWCLPCLKELKELGGRSNELRNAGINVLALSVDGLGDQEGASVADVQWRLEGLQFPFSSGMATVALVDKLQVVHDRLFDSSRRLPVPTSVLLDAEGRLAAIYRGPVPVARVLADAGALSISGKALYDRVAPLGGRWLSVYPRQPLAQLARQLAEDGYLEDAMAFVAANKERVSNEPKYAGLLGLLAYQLRERGRYDEAVRFYREAIRAEASLAERGLGHLDLGITFHRQGRREEAEAEFHRAIRSDPKLARAYVYLGIELAGRRQFDAAIVEYRKALRLKPRLVIALFNMAAALLAKGDIEGSINVCERAIVVEPDATGVHFVFAEALTKQQRIDEAVAQYREVLRRDPDHVLAHRRLITLFRQRRLFDEAIVHLRHLVQIDNDDPSPHFHLATLLELTGKPADAVRHYREALRANSNHQGAQNNLAWILATHTDETIRDGTEAVHWAEKIATSTAHAVPGVLDTLAAAYASARRYDEAVATAEKAVELYLQRGEDETAEEVQRRQKLYEANQPYRQQ